MMNSHVPTIAPAAADVATRNAIRFAAVLGFVLLTAAATLVKIPLPGTPVPATLQTLVVLLAGILLGPRLATVSLAIYLALGGAGFVLFAGTGGATLGYLIGFVAAQPVIGLIARPTGDSRGTFGRLVAAVAVGNAVVFALGLAWLWLWSGQSSATLAMGFLPFAGVDLLLKSTAAVLIGALAMRPIRRLLGVA